MTTNKPGRNDPCPCGSGKKYKKCCEQNAAVQTPVASSSGFSIPQALQNATMYFQSGNFQQSELLYKQILSVSPNQPDALQWSGLFAMQRGELDAAISLISKALAAKPDYVEAHVNLGAALQAKQDMGAAESCYRKAITLRPSYAEVHSNLGVVLRAQGRLEEAAACFTRAIQLKPDYSEAYGNLGVIFKETGQVDEAIKYYRQALSLRPDFVEALSNLGVALNEQGHTDEAISSYRKALALRPDYAEANTNLGTVLKEQGQFDEAKAVYQRALAVNPYLVEAHVNLAQLMQDTGKAEEALIHYRNALDIAPTLLAAHQGIHLALQRIVPEWHVPMMNEHRRNQAYFDALQNAITPDSTVFEIGTGSGLLSMMAAKSGAKQVTTCEVVPLIAAVAQRIIEDNGFEKSIKVIAKKSGSIEVGADMAEKADILVSEVFSSELLGEDVLPSIEDAKHRLLKPEGRVIPALGHIAIALFTGDDMRQNLMVDDTYGFNLQHFNSVVSKKRMVARSDLNVTLLSDGINAFTFDFQNDRFFPAETKTINIPVTTSGRCYGIIQWMRLQMDETGVFENHPCENAPVANWQQSAFMFDQAVDLEVGQVVVISAQHDRKVCWFFLDEVKPAK